jgi:hypothetical protein
MGRRLGFVAWAKSESGFWANEKKNQSQNKRDNKKAKHETRNDQKAAKVPHTHITSSTITGYIANVI